MMDDNVKSLRGLIIRRVGPLEMIKHGKLKREIYADMGSQRYVIDEIRDHAEKFRELKPDMVIDVQVYINGLDFLDGSRKNCLCIKKYFIKNNNQIKNYERAY